MNKGLKILIGVLIVILVLAVAKDMIIKVSVESGARVVTGLPLKIQSLRVGLIRTLVGIKNLRVLNPKNYPDKVMLDMPEIYVDYDLPAIMKGKVHLNEVRINLKEFVVVKNADGDLNLNEIKVVQAQERGRTPEPPAPVKEKAKEPELLIDSLELKIGKVVYKDYSGRGEPTIREFELNINEKYENIDDPNKLVALIIVRALMNTTVGRLANFDMKNLKGSVSDTLASAQKVVAETAAEATARAKETAAQATKAAKETTEAVKKGFGVFGK